MRAACGWERGRSGQGKYNEEANGSQVVNALGIGRSRPARDADKLYAGGGRGAQWGESTARGRWPRAGPEGASVQEGRLLHRPRGRNGPNGPRVVLERTKSRYLSKFRSSDSCGLCLFGLIKGGFKQQNRIGGCPYSVSNRQK
jgi:hypothetical protein